MVVDTNLLFNVITTKLVECDTVLEQISNTMPHPRLDPDAHKNHHDKNSSLYIETINSQRYYRQLKSELLRIETFVATEKLNYVVI